MYFRERVRRRLRRRATAPGFPLRLSRGRSLHAGIEHADGFDAGIGAERDREKSSARRTHDRNFVHGDLAVQRRAGSYVFFLGPVDRGAHVIRGLLPLGSTLLRNRAYHQDAVRGDRGEKAREIRAVDRAPAVAPHHHRQGVLLGKRVQRRRAINVKARRAERGFGRDLVRSRLRLRRTFERQCPRDHVTGDAGRLREARPGACEKRCGSNNDGLSHNPSPPERNSIKLRPSTYRGGGKTWQNFPGICTRSTSEGQPRLGVRTRGHFPLASRWDQSTSGRQSRRRIGEVPKP